MFVIIDREIPEYFENFNLRDIHTPINADRLEELLNECNYDGEKTNYLVQGFKEGFDLGYRGRPDVQLTAPNLKFTIGNKTILWNKMMNEVKEQRYAGPFEEIPFEFYIQSPVGLVPKDGGKKTRLIFHLSYPKDGTTSVNHNTPTEMSKVKYKDFDKAVQLCLKFEQSVTLFFGKSDLSNAFRNLPILKEFWKFLVMKAQSPFDGRFYYFVDKCLPFGASISCAAFQAFSDALAHIIQVKTNRENVNYLDDFLFIEILKQCCNYQLQVFIHICQEINFPVSQDKTVWATEMLTFLGLTLDGRNHVIRIPVDKIQRALTMIQRLLNRSSKKMMLRELQQLCGFLNFLNKAIIPGRAFTRRFYSQGNGLTKPHHHLKIKPEMKADLLLWEEFLKNEKIFSRPFFHLEEELHYAPQVFYTDASSTIGAGGICNRQWFMIQWDPEFLRKFEPSINYLELYALSVGILSWIKEFANKTIVVYCDNQSIIHMVNKSSSRCGNCMVLIRMLVLHCMVHNVKIRVDYVPSKSNVAADHLSRGSYKQFMIYAKQERLQFNRYPTNIPDSLWPMEKVYQQL